MVATIWILSIVLVLSLVWSIDYKLKYDKLKKNINKKTDKVDDYLKNVKTIINDRHKELFGGKTKGFYHQELSYNDVAGQIKVKVYIKKENEYENDMLDISYDHIEIDYNKSNARTQILEEWVKENFVKTLKNDDDITWLILKNKLQIDRKNKLQNLLKLIDNEEQNKRDYDSDIENETTEQ